VGGTFGGLLKYQPPLDSEWVYSARAVEEEEEEEEED